MKIQFYIMLALSLLLMLFAFTKGMAILASLAGTIPFKGWPFIAKQCVYMVCITVVAVFLWQKARQIRHQPPKS